MLRHQHQLNRLADERQHRNFPKNRKLTPVSCHRRHLDGRGREPSLPAKTLRTPAVAAETESDHEEVEPPKVVKGKKPRATKQVPVEEEYQDAQVLIATEDEEVKRRPTRGRKTVTASSSRGRSRSKSVARSVRQTPPVDPPADMEVEPAPEPVRAPRSRAAKSKAPTPSATEADETDASTAKSTRSRKTPKTPGKKKKQKPPETTYGDDESAAEAVDDIPQPANGGPSRYLRKKPESKPVGFPESSKSANKPRSTPKATKYQSSEDELSDMLTIDSGGRDWNRIR